MNWEEIKKKYPKSINKLFGWLSITEYDSKISKETGTRWYQFERDYLQPCEGCPWNDRNLYDFFDEQGIMCYLEFDVETQIWEYGIVEKYEDGDWSGGGAGAGKPEERKKAEKYMFLKAFEILEENVN